MGEGGYIRLGSPGPHFGAIRSFAPGDANVSPGYTREVTSAAFRAAKYVGDTQGTR